MGAVPGSEIPGFRATRLADPQVRLGERIVATPLGTSPAALSNAERPTPSAWLVTFIIVSLIGYQLRRNHRFLRPQRFTEF
jgi:hypothetical protein